MQKEAGLVARIAHGKFSQVIQKMVDHSEDFQWKWFW